jgi:hypothetical protein
MAVDRSIIDEYERGGQKLAQAIAGLSRQDLIAVPPADADVGKWSIQQVVIHTADSDLISADRMKRIVAEDNPTLIGYDETKFAAGLFYDEQSAEDAVRLVELNRRQFARVLRKLPEAAFARKGSHNERGVLTLEQYLRGTVTHIEHHLKFIRAKRKLMGKE